MKNFLFVAALNSSIDNENNSLSIFSCLENIDVTAKETPVPQKTIRLPVRFELISGWTVESNKENFLTIKHQLVDPFGKLLMESPERSIRIKAKSKRIRHREKVPFIHITSEGEYYFKLLQKKKDSFKETSLFPLEITLRKQKK